MRLIGSALILAVTAVPAFPQVPQPFPRPGETRPSEPPTRAPAPPRAPAADTPPPPAAPQPPAGLAEPTPEAVFFPVYPAARFLASYDAGRGQRYNLFGTTATFADIVTYYRSQLNERGSLVFREPATHMFEIGRFRDETMAFPPGVTVKDWTWGGSQGYPNPRLDGQPERFPTVIMIVPPPADGDR